MARWMTWVGLGAASLVFGVLALANAVAASVAVTVVTGVLFLVAGVGQVLAGLAEEGTARRVFTVGLGALMLFLGGSFLVHPMEGTVSLAILVTILIAVSGVIRLALAWNMRATRFFWPMLATGALSVLLAGYILANFAAVSVALLGILLGVELLFNGAGLIALGLFLRALR